MKVPLCSAIALYSIASCSYEKEDQDEQVVDDEERYAFP